MAKKEYKELNLRQKCELIHFLESHSERQTAEAFGVSKTTVNNIKKRKNEYLDRIQTESEKMSRKKRKTEFDDINSLTLKWYTEMKGLNLKLSGPKIQEVAIKFARELNQPDFKASSGWLESFKMRNNISSKVLTGDSNEVDPKAKSKSQGKVSMNDEIHEENTGTEATVLISELESASEFVGCDVVITEYSDSKDVFGNVLKEIKNEEGIYHNEEEKPLSLSHNEVYDMLEKITSCYATVSCPEILMSIYQAKKIVADKILNDKKSIPD